jgi:uncharacterized protein YcbX
MSKIAQIFRFPVKGLSAEALDSVELQAGKAIPGDRLYAIAHGSTQFRPDDPQYLPPAKFLMLKRNERLAALKTRFNEERQELIIDRDGKTVARGQLSLPVGRKMLEQFFAAYLGDEVRGSPKILTAPGHTFADDPHPCLSLINISSVRELERIIGMPLDPLRFRGNLYFDTGRPWDEFEWVGREIVIGKGSAAATLTGMARTERCAATGVNPNTGQRDANIPKALNRAFGHMDLGIYATVSVGHRISVGDTIEIR